MKERNSTEAVEYPRLWEHKETKKKVRVMPWWETVKDGEIEKVDELGTLLTEVAGKACKFGVITQVGYLIENSYGVWIGVGPKAIEIFEDKGKWVKPEESK